jgi:FixJ family two-component response regulator
MTQEEEGSTVFVVDDDPDVREAIRTLVTAMDLSIVEFENAEDFLRKFDTAWTGCIVADVGLDSLRGMEHLALLSQAGYGMPVVTITDCATTETVVRAMRSGAVTVLDKPLVTSDLRRAVTDALARDKLDRAKLAQIFDLKSRFSQLTEQERTVLRLIVSGYINKQISKHLDVSVRTIESRRQQIFKKTGARNLGELMWHAMLLRAEGYDWLSELEAPPEEASQTADLN